MIGNLLTRIFGSHNQRELQAMDPLVKAINDLEPAMQAMSDEELAGQTAKFRKELAEGKTLDDILVPAFATVREAGRRALGMRHFDVQLKGGIALHQGKIAEMGTGEGKTLVATLAVYLNALKGEGAHVITVNDYLAKRDAEWMGKLYTSLGMSVGAIVHGMDDEQRRAAYAKDITYGTNNEFGFDYLRDNMKFSLQQRVQRGHAYAIVDEVDSILIDEARTPLIISGPSEESTDLYNRINSIIPALKKGEIVNEDDPDNKYETGDYIVDEKRKTATLTDDGVAKVEKLLGITNMYDPANIDMINVVQVALKAHTVYKKGEHYEVQNGKVVIVDENTGRLQPGRRWSDGLHQAIEAKEHVAIERENQTLATVTYQNYFRMYKKLSGMTGTAATEAAEFDKIYKLGVVTIPPNKKLLREIFNDLVYRTEEAKFIAVAKEIQRLQATGQPVLVGTVSVEKSEKLSKILAGMGVEHQVLNAKHHAREAEIVAQAGRLGAVTVSTNMAGRGTDIKLGGDPEGMAKAYANKKMGGDPDTLARMALAGQGKGEQFMHPDQWKAAYEPVFKEMKAKWDEFYNPAFAEIKVITDAEKVKVKELKGLHIIGTERHESRRIDNQLSGRSARQGDPGSVQFFVSLEDRLVRLFGGDKIKNFMTRLNMPDDEAIESGIISRLITAAQKKVEGENFSARKQLIEYDDVMNMQRKVVYSMRDSLLNGEDQKEFIMGMAFDTLDAVMDKHLPEGSGSYNWDWSSMEADMMAEFGIVLPTADLQEKSRKEVTGAIRQIMVDAYEAKEKEVGAEQLRVIEQHIMLTVIDAQWKDHLVGMDWLKEGIGLRGYGQKDPLLEYKREGYDMFKGMIDRVKGDTVRYLYGLTKQEPEVVALPPEPVAQPVPQPVPAAMDTARKAVEQVTPNAEHFTTKAAKPATEAPAATPELPAVVPPKNTPKPGAGPANP